MNLMTHHFSSPCLNAQLARPHLPLFAWGLLVMLLTLLCPPAKAQTLVEARADTVQIMVGDRARVFLSAQIPANSRLSWPAIPDTFNHLEIAERGKIDTLAGNGSITYKQRLSVTGFDSGLFTIPAFPFAVNSGSQTDTFYTTPLPLTVLTVAVDTTQPYKPIVEIMAVQSSWQDYLLYIIAGVILATILITILVLFITRKKKIKTTPQKALSLHEAAMQALASLEKQNLWQEGNVKEYYVRLTAIVRQYIEYRFQMPALELTTDEILASAARIPELSRNMQQMDILLRTADMAKFAKGTPQDAEHIENLELARSFVNATKQVITVTAGSNPPTTQNKK